MQPAPDADVIDTTDLSVERGASSASRRSSAPGSRRERGRGARLGSSRRACATRSSRSSGGRSARASSGRSPGRPARLKAYGRERVPRDGGVVLAMNHFSYMDPAAFGAACPRRIVYAAKIEAHRAARRWASSSARTARSPSGEASPTGTRFGACARRCATTICSACSSRGRDSAAAFPGEAKPGAAMIAIQEGVPVHPGRRVRLAAVELELQARVGRLRRADALSRLSRATRAATARRPRRSWPRSGGCGRSSADMHRLGRPDGSAARGRDVCRVERRDEHGARSGTVAVVGLPERRQVDARQPADGDARGRRLRDARRDARSQGGRLRVERASASCSSTRAASTSPTARRSCASVAEQARRRSRRPTSCSSWSTRRQVSRPATRRWRRSCAAPASACVVLANKVDDPRRDAGSARVPPARARRAVARVSALHGHGTGDLLDLVVERAPAAPAGRAARGGRGGHPGRDPRHGRTSASRAS